VSLSTSRSIDRIFLAFPWWIPRSRKRRKDDRSKVSWEERTRRDFERKTRKLTSLSPHFLTVAVARLASALVAAGVEEVLAEVEARAEVEAEVGSLALLEAEAEGADFSSWMAVSKEDEEWSMR